MDADDRPRPQYGEYATPEEVAAARGPMPEPPADPVSKSAAPISAAPAAPAATVRQPRPSNNLITVLLIVFGIWNTVTSISSYLDFGTSLSQGLEIAGYGTIGFGPVAHTAGIVLLVISFVLLLAAIGVSLQLMRLRRRSIWVPVVAGALDLLATFIATAVVVANTPAVLAVLQTH